MYQRQGFEEMLRHSSSKNVPNGIFSDIYEGDIWKKFFFFFFFFFFFNIKGEAMPLSLLKLS
jgi:hypothetical protein